MLILTRKVNQQLVIADGEIKMTVLDIQGKQVKLGIEAPEYIEVHRKEVFDKIQSEKRENNEKKEKKGKKKCTEKTEKVDQSNHQSHHHIKNVKAKTPLIDQLQSETFLNQTRSAQGKLSTDSLSEFDKPASCYAIDPLLIERVKAGEACAQLELGKMMYEQHRYNFARKFLTLALEQGVLEAQQYLCAINR